VKFWRVGLQGAGLSGWSSGSDGDTMEGADCGRRSMGGPEDGRGCCKMVFGWWGRQARGGVA